MLNILVSLLLPYAIVAPSSTPQETPATAPAATQPATPPEFSPVKDNLEITETARIKPGRYQIADIDDNGVVHISGDGITVDFQGAEFVGVPESREPDTCVGKGIVITGKNVTVRNLKVRGFKVGIFARHAPGLVIEDADVSNNFRQRLRSTPRSEFGGDWLGPHHNDRAEWMINYGAGLYVQKSDHAVIRRVRARNVQNGIVLDRVNDSEVYDNDCSFLSGWGLAMWRCNRNLVSRNAFDFCIRGYSHGVYNRGQDSAGILMFEQNNENSIVENSATHCGDGLFGFGGVESLGGTKRTGNSGNLIAKNDFSFAAAHGIEMTFSFDNRIVANWLVENAICGVWAGYSQDTTIAGNFIIRNGEAGYGRERGGVNIEHGSGNVIKYNNFVENPVGVFLWSDADEHLMEEPWVKTHHRGSSKTRIVYNMFERDRTAVQLRESRGITLEGNTVLGVEKPLDVDDGTEYQQVHGTGELWQVPVCPAKGHTRPVSGRKSLAGRQNIIMTEWGPFDFSDYAVLPAESIGGHRQTLHVAGPGGRFQVLRMPAGVRVDPTSGAVPGMIAMEASEPGVTKYQIPISAGGKTLTATGTLFAADWTVQFRPFTEQTDPLTDAAVWTALLEKEPAHTEQVRSIDYYWGWSAPVGGMPADRFATVATATVEVPPGTYRFTTISDDGVRLTVDQRRVIDNWTWHPTAEDSAVVQLSEGPHELRLEHIELEGHAQLNLTLERISEEQAQTQPAERP